MCFLSIPSSLSYGRGAGGEVSYYSANIRRKISHYASSPLLWDEASKWSPDQRGWGRGQFTIKQPRLHRLHSTSHIVNSNTHDFGASLKNKCCAKILISSGEKNAGIPSCSVRSRTGVVFFKWRG